MTGCTPGPWTISEVRTVDGNVMIVGGEGQGFGLIAEVLLDDDAALIVRACNAALTPSDGRDAD